MFTFDAPTEYRDLSKLVGNTKSVRRKSSLLSGGGSQSSSSSSSSTSSRRATSAESKNDEWFETLHPTHYKVQSNEPVPRPKGGTRHSTGGSTIATATAAAKKRKSSIMGGENMVI